MADQNELSQEEMMQLMNMSLNDLADMPEQKPYPVGAHRVGIKSLVPKKVGDNPSFVVTFTYVENLELANATDKVPEKGDEAQMMYNMTNEYGQGNFKKFVAPLFAHFGGNNFTELVANMAGAEIDIVTSIREDKRDPNNVKQYMSIKNVSIPK